jgi:protease-4
MSSTNNSPKNKDTFIKKQLKIAASTWTIATVGTLTLAFWIIPGVLIFSFIFIASIAALISGSTSAEGNSSYSYQTIYGDSTATHKILSIPINGPIEGSSRDSADFASIFGDDSTVYGYDLKQELIAAANTGEYDGVVLEVNSPGGTIYGSKAISDGIDYFKDKTNKPVYASIQGLAASGAYWASSGADRIIADYGTGIGSIGVIYGPFTYFDQVKAIDGGILGGGVTTENGIEQYYITAGDGKDGGNPFRRLTDNEKAIIQQGVNDSYEQFVTHVESTRKITADVIKNDIGAHLYGETQALHKKLIDSTGSKDDVYRAIAEKEGIQTDYRVVSSHISKGDFWSSLGSRFINSDKKASNSKRQPAICTGSVTVPLAIEATPAQFCTN